MVWNIKIGWKMTNFWIFIFFYHWSEFGPIGSNSDRSAFIKIFNLWENGSVKIIVSPIGPNSDRPVDEVPTCNPNDDLIELNFTNEFYKNEPYFFHEKIASIWVCLVYFEWKWIFHCLYKTALFSLTNWFWFCSEYKFLFINHKWPEMDKSLLW